VPNLSKASPQQIKGQLVESQVSEYLQQHGFCLLKANFRCRVGEIDLIGRHQHHLVFVEVRFRSNALYGSAADSVDFRKQQKLIRSAELFLQQHPHLENCACRFDVVAVTMEAESKLLDIDWIQNAFCE